MYGLTQKKNNVSCELTRGSYALSMKHILLGPFS